jgi:Mn-dependent DtxR family transcriptional regulator
MKKLRESNYITVDNSGLISLTVSGEYLANKIYNKHNSLKEIFISIGVTEDVAEKDACKIEHCISDESFNCLMEHFKLK